MKSEEIRRRVLEEHRKIRGMLDELDDLNKRFEKQEDVGAEIRDFGAGLFEVFAAHLALEDTLLAPVLANREGDGPALAARLKREHCEQRSMLRYLLSRLEDEGRPTTLVARELRSFVDYVRIDMRHEEEDILRADLPLPT